MLLLFGDTGVELVLEGMLLLGLASIGAYTVWRQRDDSGGPEQSAMTNPSRDAATPTQTPIDNDAPADETTTGADVMTDTERVQTLLEANDGRMRQTAIADEFDWSASKVSRVIGKMVDEDTVEKLKLGRENLIDLVDTDE